MCCPVAIHRKTKQKKDVEDWQEKILAQAFLPPSWLGNVNHGLDHLKDTLVLYEMDVMTGNYSGAGTKAAVFIVRIVNTVVSSSVSLSHT